MFTTTITNNSFKFILFKQKIVDVVKAKSKQN